MKNERTSQASEAKKTARENRTHRP